MRYPRTYADAAGESHFGDVEEAMAPTAFVPTNPPLYLSTPQAATATVFCRLHRAGMGPGIPRRDSNSR